MRSNITRFLALMLALLVLGSSMGVFVNKHFCQEQLKSVAFYHKAQSCHAQQAVCPMHASKPADKDCCDNESEYVKLDVDKQMGPLTALTMEQPTFVCANPISAATYPQAKIIDRRLDRNKAPPPGREHSVFTQSFRL